MSDLLSSLSSFKDSLDFPAHNAIEGVEESKKVSVLRTMITQRRDQIGNSIFALQFFAYSQIL